MPSDNEQKTKSGIITSESGERSIPPSIRADGSKRKEIKIRPGYKPPEDVEVYKNRTAEAWKSRGSGGVPGAASVEDQPTAGESKTSNKNAKRREARKKAKVLDEAKEKNGGLEELTNGSLERASPEKRTTDEKPHEPTKDAEPEPDSSAEHEKQARNLKKKLRQARELREKKDKGESLLPEQFEKVIKINELIRQLDNLGFNIDGEPKGDCLS
ncbi:hypothetical protein MMC20_000971 [Loxospora ochrophaea]|nr:hypothetical protein [Loxospora ochrophaea]